MHKFRCVVASSTILAAIVITLGIWTSSASADGATVTWLKQEGPNHFSLALTVNRDACPAPEVSSDCRWFPVTSWTRQGQPCPTTADGGNYIWVGWINDEAGSELGGGEFQTTTPGFNLCTYAFYLGAYTLISEIDNADSYATPAQTP